MNEKAVEVLVGAALRGERQIKNTLTDYAGGMCANGFLLKSLYGSTARMVDAYWNRGEEYEAHFGLTQTKCSECGVDMVRPRFLLAHMNNRHDLDLLALARKFGPTT